MRIYWVVALFVLIKSAKSQESASGDEAFQTNLAKFMQLIKSQRNFENLIIYRSKEQQDCVFDNAVKQLKWPAIRINENAEYRYKHKFNKGVLILLCHNIFEEELIGIKHTKVLGKLRSSPSLLFLEDENTSSVAVRKYCKNAFQNDFYNTVVIDRNFGVTNNYYNFIKYSAMGDEYINTKNSHENITIYDEQFRNMYGAKIITHPDQIVPRTMFYYDKKGKLRLGGYFGKIFETFAQHRNATLVYGYPIEMNTALPQDVLREGTINGTLDIGSSIVVSFVLGNIEDELTYPLETAHYCYMIPLPRTVDIKDIFLLIAESVIMIYVFILVLIYSILLTLSLRRGFKLQNILLNDKIFRAFLMQTFPWPSKELNFCIKIMCIILCFSGILTCTIFQTYLQSFLAHPPLDHLIESFDDILTSNMKILIFSRHLDMLHTFKDSPTEKYPQIFQGTPEMSQLINLRQHLDTRYIYTVPDTVWRLYNNEQQYLNKQLFYFSKKLCLNEVALHFVPIRANLPYVELFNEHFLRISASGLEQTWVSSNLYELLKMNIIRPSEIADVQPKFGSNAINLDDLYWIWVMYLSCISISLLVLAGEKLIAMLNLTYRNRRKAIVKN